jgi:NADH:ubiquinone oxidoreductase subunit C
MTDETFNMMQQTLKNTLGDKITITTPRPRRMFITIGRENLTEIVRFIAHDFKTQHISTITARDTGTILEVLYHFFVNNTVLTVKIQCPYDDPTVDSIVEIFPGAILYEREINDLLGIIPKGHPDLRRLVLPDSWDKGYPLRKDFKVSGGEQLG